MNRQFIYEALALSREPVLLEPGFALPCFSGEVPEACGFVDPAQGEESADQITVFSGEEVGRSLEVAVEAGSELPEVRDQILGHGLVPEGSAFVQICDNADGEHGLLPQVHLDNSSGATEEHLSEVGYDVWLIEFAAEDIQVDSVGLVGEVGGYE